MNLRGVSLLVTLVALGCDGGSAALLTAQQRTPTPAPAPSAPERWTGDDVPLAQATSQARALFVGRLRALDTGGPGPPGATHYDRTRWAVERTLRGARPTGAEVQLLLTVQRMPASIEQRVPVDGDRYLVFVGGESFGATQIRKLLPATPANVRAVEALLTP